MEGSLVRYRTDRLAQSVYDFPMYEVEYIADGVRLASLPHAGTLRAAREIADDGVRRHHAQYALIVHNETKCAEIWPPPKTDKLA